MFYCHFIIFYQFIRYLTALTPRFYRIKLVQYITDAQCPQFEQKNEWLINLFVCK